MCFRRVCSSAESGSNSRAVLRVSEKRKANNCLQPYAKFIFEILGLGRKDQVTYQHLSGNVAGNQGTCQNAHQNQMGQ